MYWLYQLPVSLSHRIVPQKVLQDGDNAQPVTSTVPPDVEMSPKDKPVAENQDEKSQQADPNNNDDDNFSYNPMSESGMSVINGPRHNRGRYYGALCIMFTAGSGSDFLAKLVYQFLPTDISPLVSLWMAWLITLGAFLICIFALFKGKESFKILNFNYFLRIMIPALCDVFVSGGRYVALVFLPASIVSVLKNGLQLVFLAMIRGCLSQYITRWQVAGIVILWCGLFLCMLEDIFQTNADDTTYWGLVLMFFVGLFGAIRNSIEEFLLKKEGFHPDFILGFEGCISFTVMVIIGIIFFFSTISQEEWPEVPSQVGTFFGLYPGSLICVFVFMVVLVTKKSTQFHVTKMSSAMTRKLFQQFYPIGVWFMVLIAYYAVNPRFGEAWDTFQWMRVFGIFFVLIGTFVYLKPEWFKAIGARICGKYENLADVV